MDLIIEFVGEVIIEGIIEIIQNKKISKWIRYPLLIIILLFYTAIVVGITIVSIKCFHENVLFGIILLFASILLIAGLISIIRKSISKKEIQK